MEVTSALSICSQIISPWGLASSFGVLCTWHIRYSCSLVYRIYYNYVKYSIHTSPQSIYILIILPLHLQARLCTLESTLLHGRWCSHFCVRGSQIGGSEWMEVATHGRADTVYWNYVLIQSGTDGLNYLISSLSTVQIQPWNWGMATQESPDLQGSALAGSHFLQIWLYGGQAASFQPKGTIAPGFWGKFFYH